MTKKIPGLSDATAKRLFQRCLEAISGANVFMKVLYHSALWLTSDERHTLIKSGHQCIASFLKCANLCYGEGLTRFKLQPKLHMFGELVYEMEHQERQHVRSLNPLTWATQQDEDFVGRICTYSRTVSIRTIHSRTLTRYQVALAALL